MPNYFYDIFGVRYDQYCVRQGRYDWLFFPGGPGLDSSYFYGLVKELDLPGTIWLIDLPGNGTNKASENNFDNWENIFLQIIERFCHPVLVGHSFGGMFPLLFPELEKLLEGFIILNSAPSLWLQEAVSYSKQFNLPDLTKEMQEFTLNPSQKTFEIALNACIPYYFSKESLEKGSALITQTPFCYEPAVWWQRKAIESHFSAQWIPQKVPTLIIGAKYDCICPFSLFQNDTRFHRSNIELLFVEDAGHAPWIENPIRIKEAFTKISHSIQSLEDTR